MVREPALDLLLGHLSYYLCTSVELGGRGVVYLENSSLTLTGDKAKIVYMNRDKP